MIDLAHIHPMLVHFPIVLFLIVPLFDAYILAKGGSLSAPDSLPQANLVLLALGAGFAVLAVLFGDAAADIALQKGLKPELIGMHLRLGGLSMWLALALAVVRGAAWHFGIALGGRRGRVLCALGLGLAALVLAAAYEGGHLVYGLGVNVAPARP